MRSWLVVMFVGVVAAACQGEAEDAAADSQRVEDLPPLAPERYQVGEAGLRALMRDLMDAAATGDRARAKMLAKSLELARHETWFDEIFGTEVGAALAREYAEAAGHLPELAALVASLERRGQTRIAVEQFDSPDDPAAVVYQSLALKRMIRMTPLYSVRFSSQDGKKTFHLWSFVYHRGMFHWIGKTKALADEPASGEVDLREYRMRDGTRVREILQR